MSLLSFARELDRHYISSRHPNAHPEGTSHEAYDEETSQSSSSRKKYTRFCKENY